VIQLGAITFLSRETCSSIESCNVFWSLQSNIKCFVLQTDYRYTPICMHGAESWVSPRLKAMLPHSCVSTDLDQGQSGVCSQIAGVLSKLATDPSQ
jgi:hypothetical protein